MVFFRSIQIDQGFKMRTTMFHHHDSINYGLFIFLFVLVQVVVDQRQVPIIAVVILRKCFSIFSQQSRSAKKVQFLKRISCRRPTMSCASASLANFSAQFLYQKGERREKKNVRRFWDKLTVSSESKRDTKRSLISFLHQLLFLYFFILPFTLSTQVWITVITLRHFFFVETVHFLLSY